MVLDKDIEIVKELVKNLKEKFKRISGAIAIMPRIEEEDVQAIENVLKELENYKSQKIYHCYQYEVYELLKELETYKKMAELLAEDKIIPKCRNCSDEDTHECTECALDWARKEVEKDKKV